MELFVHSLDKKDLRLDKILRSLILKHIDDSEGMVTMLMLPTVPCTAR